MLKTIQIAITYAANEDAAKDAVASIRACGAEAVAIRANILDDGVGEAIIRDALKGLKTDIIHILINNAALLVASLQLNTNGSANHDIVLHLNT